jgi:hypothetical protein
MEILIRLNLSNVNYTSMGVLSGISKTRHKKGLLVCMLAQVRFLQCDSLTFSVKPIIASQKGQLSYSFAFSLHLLTAKAQYMKRSRISMYVI